MTETLAQALALLDPYKEQALNGIASAIIFALIALAMFAVYLIVRRAGLGKLGAQVHEAEKEAESAKQMAEALQTRKKDVADVFDSKQRRSEENKP